jgi:hypothetical protein|tara:strand:+ start:147 stop:386 length:240 start_codon:yes stop_codon:yes gene_type:complete
MGFHKRYIDDDQIIRIYRSQGCQAVIDWFSSGVDAVILSGELSEKVHTLMNILEVDKIQGFNRISETIALASLEKGHKK